MACMQSTPPHPTTILAGLMMGYVEGARIQYRSSPVLHRAVPTCVPRIIRQGSLLNQNGGGDDESPLGAEGLASSGASWAAPG